MTKGPSVDRLTKAAAGAAFAQACRQVGIDDHQGRFLRLGENAMFELPQLGMIVRIARSTGLRERVAREIALARWLEDLDFPAVRVAPDLPQVVEADGRLITFWQRAEEISSATTLTDLGKMLRAFHDLPAPPFFLPQFEPFKIIPNRLDQAEGVSAMDLEFLRARLDQLRRAYANLSFAIPQGLIHGDAHRSNLLKSPDRVLLLDFDVIAHGPREWDLTPTALAAGRFGLPKEQYDEFVRAYGWDVYTWDSYQVMAQMRELTMTTWLMQNVTESPVLAEEFTARVEDMRVADFSRRWKAF